jgi:hypothetical protein
VKPDNKIIAYKFVNNDLSSNYDQGFKYKIGKIAKAKISKEDINDISCSKGLHVSHLSYTNGS